jgi:anti-sigma B factor antagonist
MEIPTRERRGVTILDPKGKITIGKGDVALRKAIQTAVGAGGKKILINFDRVTRVDSSGVAELVAAHETVEAGGGMLKVTNLPPKIQDLLSLTQLMTVLDVFANEDEAVASFD